MSGSSDSSSPLIVLAVVVALAGAGAIGATMGRGETVEASGGISVIPAGIGITLKKSTGEEVVYTKNGVVELEPGAEYEYETEDGAKGTFVMPEVGRAAALCFDGDYTEEDDRARQIAEGSGTCVNSGGRGSLVRAESGSGFEEEMGEALETGEDESGEEE